MKMLRQKIRITALLLNLCTAVTAQQMYYPPASGSWETTRAETLGWNKSKLPELFTYLKQKHTRAFIILVNGRIVVEEYMNGHKQWKPWYWASAGKTLTSAAFGIAQQQGIVTINAPVSTYLGTGWTTAPAEKERQITCRHLLSMTSGLDDGNGHGTTPADLTYKADAGTRWAYHNVYVVLQQVLEKASGKTWDSYFATALKDKTGMTGLWRNGRGALEDFSVYWSNARSMARFGLLALNNGKWNNEQIVPRDYFIAATAPSQDINKAYGYLWWLNGKQSYHLPASQTEFKGSLIPNGPTDMYMALGKNDQKIYVIPSLNMVVIRMGESANDKTFALSNFDNELWEKINAVIK